MAAIFWLAFGATIGFAYEFRYTYWFDVPFGLQYFLQAVNGVNLSLLVISIMPIRTTLPYKLRYILGVQSQHCLSLGAQAAASFIVIAFYELFSPVVGFSLALFAPFWLAHLAVLAWRA